MPPKKQFRQANLSPFFQAPTPSDIDASSQKVQEKLLMNHQVHGAAGRINTFQ